MNSELLKELSNADSVASVEDEVRSILYRELAKYSDEVFSDRLGSIIFHKRDFTKPFKNHVLCSYR